MKSTIEKQTAKRDSSIELLRIISAIGVVILHYMILHYNNSNMGGRLDTRNQTYLIIIYY